MNEHFFFRVTINVCFYSHGMLLQKCTYILLHKYFTCAYYYYYCMYAVCAVCVYFIINAVKALQLHWFITYYWWCAFGSCENICTGKNKWSENEWLIMLPKKKMLWGFIHSERSTQTYWNQKCKHENIKWRVLYGFNIMTNMPRQ